MSDTRTTLTRSQRLDRLPFTAKHGRLLVGSGIGWALDRVLNPGPEMARRFPGLAARAAQYVPMLKSVVSAVLGAGAVVLLLETWGLNSLDWFDQGTLGRRLIDTLVAAARAREAFAAAIERRKARR